MLSKLTGVPLIGFSVEVREPISRDVVDIEESMAISGVSLISSLECLDRIGDGAHTVEVIKEKVIDFMNVLLNVSYLMMSTDNQFRRKFYVARTFLVVDY